MLNRLPRPTALAICATPVLALLAVAALAPLPFSVAQPGPTTNVLGEDGGKPVIDITGAPTRPTEGKLRAVTIVATGPDASVHLSDVFDGWFAENRAVMPRDSVYPTGGSTKDIEQHNAQEMKGSQDAATEAALNYLGKSSKDIKVDLQLGDVGGPSAGLLFSLGIIDKLDGDGSGGDITGGRSIAGTGTIDDKGKVGPVGGVSLKVQAADRDGATVFLVPKAECQDAKASAPKSMKLISVSTLKGTMTALTNLEKGSGTVPQC
ncbi:MULTISPECIES: S16 family serine protease [unclassified Streptomyces]|uniref:S16 family serine protease n=1 Tax=unclassified Streptomyces TaxID=2593676 RepID=UPI00278BAE85|nr:MULTISPECIES: S16 family serine protease [unclassified Streptomyces]